MTDDANTGAKQATLPLFYTNPVPVDRVRHKDWKVKQRRSFAYAAKTNAIPVVLEEFPVLEGHYPIVFTTGDNPAAVALVGIRPEENLFLEQDGSWRANAPIPAYVRRYPFILVEVPDNRLILCMEEDSNVVSTEGEFPLFEGENGAPAGQEALNFCTTFNQSAMATQAFCQELKKHGLLVDQRIDINAPGNRRISVSGFSVIDEKKFNALPDDVFVEWRKRNWIGLIYTHMLSMQRWSSLIEAAAKRDGGDKAAACRFSRSG